jgi:oxygen-independent coproporphyrinogen-3 oxidase
LELALREGVDHFSLYSLSVEEGTPLKRWIDRGLLTAPDDDLAATMYETATMVLDHHGFKQYEISNWAREIQGESDGRCRHNLQYWRGLPYLGFGAGAHGFSHGVRTENLSAIPEYIGAMQQSVLKEFPASPACKSTSLISVWDQMQEYLMVGFRLTEEGVSKTTFQDKFGKSMEGLFERQLRTLLKQGLIEIHPLDEDRYRLTTTGRLFGNRVFSQFVGNRPPKN